MPYYAFSRSAAQRRAIAAHDHAHHHARLACYAW
jgi:hypothetical protein